MTRFLFSLAALALAPATGLEADAFGCQDSSSCKQGTSLLQHGSRKVASSAHRQVAIGKIDFDPAKLRHAQGEMQGFDMNGRLCALCETPSEERAPGNTFVQRSDCGNHSIFEHPDKAFLPLSSFRKEATEEQNETNAWCELNLEKGCADAVYNKDYLMFAKSVELSKVPIFGYSVNSFDQHYCYYNGWLEPEIRALQHDYEGMTAKGKELCKSEHLVQLGANGNMTLMDMMMHYLPYLPGTPISNPNIGAANFLAAWTCAMGSSACDMTYCAWVLVKELQLSYCNKEILLLTIYPYYGNLV